MVAVLNEKYRNIVKLTIGGIMVEVRKISGSSKYAIYKDGVMVPGSKGEKKKVTRHAAELAGVDYKTFIKMKKEEN